MKKMTLSHNDKIINDLIDDLRKIPFLAKYDINFDNANLLYIMNEEHNNCKKCKGLQYCSNETFGHYTDCVVVNGKYRAKSVRCKYKKESIMLQEKSSLIKTLFMPKSTLEAKIENFDVINENRKRALNYAINFTTSYRKDNFIKGLMLTGAFCTGKTFLLGGIANELAKRDVSTLLIYFPDLVRELKNAIGSPRFDELINMLKTIDVLMLDDLGSEMMTPWLRDEVIGPIINYRMSERLPLFISSNLSFEELGEHFSSTKGGNDLAKSTRIMDRIKSLVVLCNMGSETFER